MILANLGFYFPVAVCQNNKIFCCKLFTKKCFHGYTASKKAIFLEPKVHMLVAHEGIPIQFLFTPENVAGISAFRHFNFRELKGAKIYAYCAYNGTVASWKNILIFLK